MITDYGLRLIVIAVTKQSNFNLYSLIFNHKFQDRKPLRRKWGLSFFCPLFSSLGIAKRFKNCGTG